ncbi:hypothetical protein F4810DRAFT_244921 [Camillea tinctor]|nr:hypothetical protein F4810DRAFT_244921 [Camillea tinctor]
MSFKRSRADFEADLQPQQSPYVLFGTPLPPLDPDVRDDGSYVPVWKQEVRDERGRKRLHGAFTGGWSAGYFNTVGSKEGWTPSTFVSSRTNRRKDDNKSAQQRIEDFMDEEDLADAAEAEKLQTAEGFAGLGSTAEEGVRRGGVADLFRAQGETIGVKLLRKMGWKDGQGIGPKVRRKARLDLNTKPVADQGEDETYLFAPDNASMISFVRKLDRKGLGYEGESRLTPIGPGPKTDAGESSDDDTRDGPLRRPNALKKKSNKFAKGGIGIGILNDTGSDDEDPYEIGPKISYNRVIGGDKKKKKANITSVNPALRSAPVFISKKSALAKAGKNLRKCHDGRLPLDGFVFGTEEDILTSAINSAGKYPPPAIPPDWKSSKQRKAETDASNYVSTADAAKVSKLDPKARAALLGEAQLPGKSVFDFLSASARDRLAAATGKSNLPPALGEIPAEYALSDAERQQETLRQLPQLDKATAVAALARGASGGAYADNEAKRGRYRAYLEHAAGFSSSPSSLPRPPAMKHEDWARELHEFYSCARIFKPMTGLMASRFTTATSSSSLASGSPADPADANLVARPPPKPKDPAEEAAAMGMYGAMTRSVTSFFPSRLLCKRFNVPPPSVDAQPDARAHGGGSRNENANAVTLDELMRQAQQQEDNDDDDELEDTHGNNDAVRQGAAVKADHNSNNNNNKPVETAAPPPVINADVNEALEGKRAQDEVLRAIFGDSSDEEE